MKYPPEIQAEYDRLLALCRDDQDLVVDVPSDPNGVWKVYLRDAAPLVDFPSDFWEMNTYIKHAYRTGKLNMERLMQVPDGVEISDREMLTDFWMV